MAIARRRLGVLVGVFLLTVAATVAFSLLQEKQYTGTATLFFRDAGLDQRLFGSTFFPESNDPARQAATNVELVSLESVAERAAEDLGMTTQAVVSQVTISEEGQADLITVDAEDPDPVRAAEIANTLAKQYVAFRRQADRQTIDRAKNLIERQLEATEPGTPQEGALRERLDELTVFGALQTGNAELVQQATVPTSVSSPQTTRNVVLGAVLGLLFGFGLAVFLDRLDRRVREPQEAGELIGRPVLGLVHESGSLKSLSTPFGELPVPDADAFRSIRSNLHYFNVDQEIGSVLVTSPLPGDGKSTIAWNLAAAAATSGERVLLIEADLRRPSLAQGIPGLRPEAGLSEVLSEQLGELAQAPLAGMAMGHTLARAVVAVPVATPANGDVPTSIDVLFAGSLPPNPSDLIESDRMAELIMLADELYDFVVVDTPPASLVADAVPLVNQVDGVVVVVRLASSTKHSVERLRDQLDNLNAPTLGVVVNSVSARNVGYGRSYYRGAAYGEARGSRLGALLRR